MDTGHVDPHFTCHDTVIRTTTRKMGSIGAGDERLRRRTAGVDARAPHQMPLDDGDGHARCGQPGGHRGAGLAGADNDRIKASGHDASSSASAGPSIATIAIEELRVEALPWMETALAPLERDPRRWNHRSGESRSQTKS